MYKLIVNILFACFVLVQPYKIKAQDTTYTKFSKNSKSSKLNKLFSSLESSFSSKDDKAIASNYENIAKAYYKELNYNKAEEYYRKALELYTNQKQNDDVARVSRSLAKTEEKQGKNQDAAQHYELAQKKSNDKIDYTINSNDAQRLSPRSSPQQQYSYSQSNLQLFKKKGNKDEIVDVYMQQANTSSQLNNTNDVINNYNEALNYADNNSSQQIQIKDELANAYLNSNQTEKAKEIKNEIITEAQQQQDIATEIQQKQSLASIYLKEAKHDEALDLLQESYEKAMSSHNTLEARKSLELLINYYQTKGDYNKSISLYDQFLKRLDTLVKSDSSLMDYSLITATEEKIQQLEKEKKLQDELMASTQRFNYILGSAVVLIIVFLLLVIRAFYSVKKKNKEIALQSLRREMNPHFIFNSLNSVNQFIASNDELEANKYLSSYSNLMRTIMENSNKDFILLGKEVELIKKYLALEHLRFKEKFDYSINVDDNIDIESIYAPNMLIQPQLENAIWHGLRYKEEKGMLSVNITLLNNSIKIVIDDDGIGLTKSRELKTINQKTHTSRGLNNTSERIKLLNELYNKNIQLTISEKTKGTGTIVTIEFPLINQLDA